MNSLTTTGAPPLEQLQASPGFAREGRFEKGPVAVIECVQEIPCNPCENACPQGAITVGQPITNLPSFNGEKCSGCGLCLARCPGLAIFLVHKNYTDTTSTVEFPYEYLPLPAEGDTVPCGGRDGAFIADGRVLKVKKTKQSDGTSIVQVEIPKNYYNEIRTICRNIQRSSPQKGGV